MPTDFRSGLKDHLEGKAKLNGRERKLLDFLKENPQGALAKRRQARRLERMEANARMELFETGAMQTVMMVVSGAAVVALTVATAMTVGIDWSTVPWAAILKILLQVFLAILMMFI